MECKFQPGDRIVCVDAKPTQHPQIRPYAPSERLNEGQIYTVREVFPYDHPVMGFQIMVALHEIRRINNEFDGYYHARFRPAEDIEQFRRLVATLPTNLEPVE